MEFHFAEQVDDLWNDWYAFHEAALRDHGAAWLAERGFEVTWA